MTTKRVLNFIITTKKDGNLVLNTKNYDWKLELGATSHACQILKYHLDHSTDEEVDELLTRVYYTSTTMLGDIEFAQHIGTWFEKKLEEASESPTEVTEESEKENLKIVKDDIKAKSNDPIKSGKED